MNYDSFRHPRIHNFDSQLQTQGDAFLALVSAIHRTDPLANQAIAALEGFSRQKTWQLINESLAFQYENSPDALVALIESVRRPPDWVDWSRVERGARAMVRTGLLGGIVLGAKSLIEGYCSPAGNKPLVLSGRLQHYAAMRLSETARFVEAVITPGAMHPGEAGFAITLKVRLMHARVRALIARSGQWRTDLWAEPINQHDMVATIHLFSTSMMDGLETLGFQFSDLDKEDFFHLWRYVGILIGVEEALLPRSNREAHRQWSIIANTQGPPDEDSRALTRALLEDPLHQARTPSERLRAEKIVQIGRGICRLLIGNELADQLHIPRDRWTQVAPALASTLRSLDFVRRAPGVDLWLEEQGRAYWRAAVEQGSAGRPVRFRLPERLRSAIDKPRSTSASGS